MKWKQVGKGEWVSRPFFIRRNLPIYDPPTFAVFRSDGSNWGKLIAAGLPSLAAAKAAAEEAARVQ